MNVQNYTFTVFLSLVVSVVCLVGCENIPTEVITTSPSHKVAVAAITAIDESNLTGTATFTETVNGIHTVIEIQNAVPGLHATHLHIGSCTDIGPHWHPMNVPAGTVGTPVAEATSDTPPIGIGEIGNIPVDDDGTGVLEFTTQLWSIGTDTNTDILGKLILIHETGDTFRTNPHIHHTTIPNIDVNTAAHSHMGQIQTGSEKSQPTNACTLAVLGQQIDLEVDHHLRGEETSAHSHDLLELLLQCFLSPTQLLDPAIFSVIPITGSQEHQDFLNIEPKSLAAYHEFLISIGIPVDPNFFTNQYTKSFPTDKPEAYEKQMQDRLTHLYITSQINFDGNVDAAGYNLLLTMFLDDRTTAWVLGHFQGDDTAFGEWIVNVLENTQVRPGGGSRIGCGEISLLE